jgi:hypothetical protein
LGAPTRQAVAEPAPFRGAIEIAKVEQGVITFAAPPGVSAPAEIKTGLHNVQVLGPIYSRNGGKPEFPSILVSGLPCVGCEERRGLALFSLRSDVRPLNFVYPGRVRDRKTGQTLYQSRAFYGSCLVNRNDVYVVFQNEKIDRRGNRMRPSVFIAEVTPQGNYEKLLSAHAPRLDAVLKRVRSKDCAEIRGTDRQSIAFALPALRGEAIDDEE